MFLDSYVATSDDLPEGSQTFLAALTLRERLDLLSRQRFPSSSFGQEAERGRRRLAFWKGQRSFAEAGRFEARLRADGIVEKDLGALLSHGLAPLVPALQAEGTPPWAETLARLWQGRGGKAPVPEPAAVYAFPSLSFHPFVAPLVADAQSRLKRRLAALFKRSPPDLSLRLETVVPPLVLSLQLRLCQHASRALVLALHLARMHGELPGSTPQERFQTFTASLKSAQIRRVLVGQYPVLARHLAEQVRLGCDAIVEMAQRLLADWNDLRRLLDISAKEELAAVSTGEGDRHRGGRSVSILSFSSGLRVVYKPRSLAAELHFQDLLRWLDARGDHPPFRTLRILEKGSHGWMEYVRPSSCSTTGELERFYQRQGAFLALLYALEATDVHAENLIAVGEQPVLVDLESLLHPRFALENGIEFEMLSRSVLRVGLLPRRLGDPGEDGADLSGLGGTRGQLSPQPVPAWENPGTDLLRFVRKRREVPGSQNRPALNGSEADPIAFTGAIEKGFESMYRLLLRHREELVAGPLVPLWQDEVRVLLRPTWLYAAILEDSFHPDMLRDALDRDRYFDRLWSADWGHSQQSLIFEAERRDLLAGDIPYFSSRPESRDLFDSQGDRLVKDFFSTCALRGAEETLAGLGEQDLCRQLAILRASLATLPASEDLARRPALRSRFRPPAGSPLQQAQAIGDRLVRLAFEKGEEAGWTTLSSQGGRHLAQEAAGIDLYSGLCGISFFLAYLASVSGEIRFERLARKAIHRVINRIESGLEETASIGAFTGLGGVVYTLTHLSVLWNDSGLLAKAQDYARLAAKRVETDEALDLLSGAAGCIGALLPLFQLTGSQEVLDVARACGDRLLARAEPLERGVGWRTSVCPTPLAGFGHGNAGFAWALAHLAAVTGDGRYDACVQAALEYERSLFVADEGNWPDLRFPGAPTHRFMVAWCHGATGIGLARLTLPMRNWDPMVREEIDAALKTSYRFGFGRNHSLCHGDFGNLELFLQAHQCSGFESWDTAVKNISARIRSALVKQGVTCGTPGAVDTPGLLLGLAGAGLTLLRLAFPGSIPCIAVLEPPKFLGEKS